MTWIAELRATIERFDPAFGVRLRPASDADRARFEVWIGGPPPPDHVALLDAMGEDDGGLGSDDDCVTRLDTVLRAFGRSRIERDRWVPLAVGLDLAFVLVTAGQPSAPPVAQRVDDEPEQLVAPSLPALAFAQAFRWEQQASGKRALFSKPTGRKRAGTARWQDHVASRLLALGYVEEWFASPIRRHFRAGAKQIVLHGSRPDREIVAAGGVDTAAFTAACGDLERLADGAAIRVRDERTLAQAHAARGGALAARC